MSWYPKKLNSNRPVYLAIVDALEEDIIQRDLKAGDKLPPQRDLAHTLGIDFTTVSRAYKEGKRRGLLVARVGKGTFIANQLTAHPQSTIAEQNNITDMGMNIPPAPADPVIQNRMISEMSETVRALPPTALRAYDDFIGSREDRTIASRWIAPRNPKIHVDNLLFCPGTQAALIALLTNLAPHRGTVACEAHTYPGFKAACQHTGCSPIGLAYDDDGLLPEAFEEACQKHPLQALYCTPTLHNPTARTWSAERRQEIADIARKYNVFIIEDDAYGFVSEDNTPPLSTYAPERSFYIAGLAKCFSSTLRVAILHCPTTAQQKIIARSLHAQMIMGSSLTKAMALQVMKSGCLSKTAEAITLEARQRRTLAQEILAPYLNERPLVDGFHVWLPLPAYWSMDDFILQLRSHNIRLVPPSAFSIGNNPPEAHNIRLCLGAAENIDHCQEILMTIRKVLDSGGENKAVI